MGFFTGGGKAARRAMGEAYQGARKELEAGYGRGRADFEAGAGRARAFRETPLYKNRQQILERHLNAEHAYSDETRGQMKAGILESRGQGLRDAQRFAGRFLGGEGTGAGLAARMYGDASSRLFGSSAAQMRDVDIESANRAVDLRTRAIDTIEGDRSRGFEEEIGIGGRLSDMELARGNALADLVHGYHMGRARNYASDSGFVKPLLNTAIPAAASAFAGPVGGFLTGGMVTGQAQTGYTPNQEELARATRAYGWARS